MNAYALMKMLLDITVDYDDEPFENRNYDSKRMYIQLRKSITA
jgi:hypothetical protein